MTMIRQLTGIATSSDVDSVGDIVKAEGVHFAKFPLPLLGGHDHKSPIGTVLGAKQVGDGIVITARLFPRGESTISDNWAAAAKHGSVAFSIGFRSTDSEQNTHGGKTYHSAVVHEVSVVSIPANSKCVLFYKEIADTDAQPASPAAQARPPAATPAASSSDAAKRALIAEHEQARKARVAEALRLLSQ